MRRLGPALTRSMAPRRLDGPGIGAHSYTSCQAQAYRAAAITTYTRGESMRICVTVAAAALAAGLGTAAHAQDSNYARSLAATCTTCHGTDGHSVGGIPPSLAGQDRNYLVQQLKEFKAGKRPATVMHQLALGYTDEQLELIATYFSKVKAGPGTAAPATRGSY